MRPRNRDNKQKSIPQRDFDKLIDDFEDTAEVSKKWYEELPDDPAEFPPVTDQVLIELKDEAKRYHDAEIASFNAKNSKSKSSDYQWIKTVLSKGTASDKVAAYTVTIQDSPVCNISAIKNLVSLVKVGKKKECIMIMETLSELFLNDLLRPDAKLKPFHQRPLSKLNELTSGNIVSRKKRLILWHFEDQLKEIYTSFVQALNTAAHDTVESNKEKAVAAMYKLLAGNPEQEKNLLTNIVNKLGDPSQKVASKTIYCLGQLLFHHPNMKVVVMSEIEKLLFRPNVSHKTQYYAICFLSQFYLNHEESEIAKNLITIYFSFFKACIKTGEVNSKMMSALLMGVNRAFPYAKVELSKLSEHIDTMYRIVHVANFNVSLHALSLLFQILDFQNSNNNRFYSALYKKILDSHIGTTTHQAILLNLIFRALKQDTDLNRVRIFIKRLLQIALNISVPMACGILFLISNLCRQSKHLLTTYQEREDSSHNTFKSIIDLNAENNCETSTGDNEIEQNTIQKEEVDDKKTDIVLGNLENNNYTEPEDKCVVNVNDIKDVKPFLTSTCYNPQQRNPAHAGGEFCIHTELLLLQYHFHPTVALYAKNIIYGDKILYSGDPLKDFTLIRFLERFVFKNPKKASDVAQASIGSHLGQRKTYVPKGLRAIPVTSMNYMNTNEQKIPEDERFMYNYLQKRKEREEQRIDNEDEEDSDMESVASDEFDEYLDKMAGANADDDDDDEDNEIDYMNEVGDSLKQNKKRKKTNQNVDESDDEGSSGDDSQDEDDDDVEEFDDEEEDGDELRDDSDDDNFDDEIDGVFSDDEDDEIVWERKESKKDKKGVKGKKGDLSSLFATAEEFSVMLEKTGASKRKAGSSNILSNTDKSNEKQLTWEEKRNTWITDKISKKKLKSNKFSGKRKSSHDKGENKKKKQKRN